MNISIKLIKFIPVIIMLGIAVLVICYYSQSPKTYDGTFVSSNIQEVL